MILLTLDSFHLPPTSSITSLSKTMAEQKGAGLGISQSVQPLATACVSQAPKMFVVGLLNENDCLL